MTKKPFTAFLIDPYTRTVTEIAREAGPRSQASLREIYRLIDCDCITAIRPEIADCNDAIYVDDNGLLHDEVALFYCTLFPYQTLAGKGLWVGSTGSGYDKSPEMDIDFVRAHILFPTE